MCKNFWLGCNELIIVFRNGTHHVIEAYENLEAVFIGNIEECIEYCKRCEIEYMEAVIG